MSGSPEAVTEFMDKIRELAAGGAAEDLETLRQAKIKHLEGRGELEAAGGADGVKIEAHDTGFYHNQILKEEYGVDQEAIREFFPLDHVVAVTLEIYQELLGLVFTEVPPGKFQSWHAELRLFVVHDSASKERVGHFYLVRTLPLPSPFLGDKPNLPAGLMLGASPSLTFLTSDRDECSGSAPSRRKARARGHLPPAQAGGRADSGGLHVM
eukprot:COSAG04_NODE_1222_length_7694_cov_1.527979_6_plen_211_part_00